MADKPKKGAKNFSALIGFLTLGLLVALLASCTGLVGNPEKAEHFLGSLSNPVKELSSQSRGIDVARYQGTIDWEQVAASGVEFAMVRVGYRTQVTGEITPDSNARYNMQEAAKHGIKLGAYFFSSAVTKEEAREEAAWVADFIAPYPITYPVAYNCEGFRQEDHRQHELGKVQRTEIALEFLKTIENYGYEAMFYSSKNEMTDNAQWMMGELEDHYKIWVAQYPGQPYPEESSYEGPYHMWQYADDGKIPGIPTGVDCNIALFSYEGVRPPKDSRAPEEARPDPEARMRFREISDEAVTAENAVNLRDIPSQGNDSTVCRVLGNGDIATRIAVSDAGWSKVVYENETYYCLTQFLTTDLSHGPGYSDYVVETVFQDVRELVTAEEEAILRNIPSSVDSGTQIVGKLLYKDVATRIGISDTGWSKLEYNGEICYCVTSRLIPVDEIDRNPDTKPGIAPEPATKTGVAPEGEDPLLKHFSALDDQVTPNIKVNLRTRPTTEDGASEIVTTVYSDEVLHRTGIDEDLGWSRVEWDGRSLYCYTEYISPVE